jgi:hypothetical protein
VSLGAPRRRGLSTSNKIDFRPSNASWVDVQTAIVRASIRPLLHYMERTTAACPKSVIKLAGDAIGRWHVKMQAGPALVVTGGQHGGVRLALAREPSLPRSPRTVTQELWSRYFLLLRPPLAQPARGPVPGLVSEQILVMIRLRRTTRHVTSHRDYWCRVQGGKKRPIHSIARSTVCTIS